MSRPWLLAGGMLAGAALAVFYIARVPDRVEPSADAIAWVNGRPETERAALLGINVKRLHTLAWVIATRSCRHSTMSRRMILPR